MKRMICFFCNQLMCFGTHHNIRRFDTDHKIVIPHLFNDTYFIQCTLHQSFCCYTMVFFYQLFFQRTTVDSYTDWYISLFCNIHNCLNTVSTSDISRIDTNFICTVFHCGNRQSIIKVNICHQWNVNLLFDFFQCLRSFHSRHCTTDNITSGCFQLQNLADSCLHIFCLCIRHRLNQNWITSTKLFISYLYNFCMITIHALLSFLTKKRSCYFQTAPLVFQC